MASKDQATARVGMEIDLKALQGQLNTASNMIGATLKKANQQGNTGSGKNSGLLGSIAGDASNMRGVQSLISGNAAALTRLGIAGIAAYAGLQLVQAGFRAVGSVLSGAFDLAKSAGQIEQNSLAFNNLAKNVGYSEDQVSAFRAELSKLDYNIDEQTQIMNNLTQALGGNGLSKEALAAAKAMRDLSVAGGVSTKEGIQTMSTAIATLDTTILRNYGVTKTASQLYEEYAGTLNRTADSLTVAEKQHAILNGIIAAGAQNMGLADQARDKFQRGITRLTSNFEVLKGAIGQVFLPLANGIIGILNQELDGLLGAVDSNRDRFQAMGEAIRNWVLPAIQGFISWVKSIPWVGIIDGIYRTITGLSLLARVTSIPFQLLFAAVKVGGLALASLGVVIERVIAFFSTMAQVASAAWDALSGKASAGQFITRVNSAMNNFGKSTLNLIGALGQSWGDLFGDMGKTAMDQFNGISGDIQKLTKGFQIDKWFQGLAGDSKKLFKEGILDPYSDALGGMSNESLKAARKIAEDLAKENEDFARSQAKALADYTEQLAELVAKHRDQISDLQRDIKKEQDKYEKSYEERTRAYQDELAKINREDDDRKNDVNKQIAEELAKGRFADQTKLASLRARLAYEDAAHKKAVADAEKSYNEDTANAKSTHDEQLAELQTSLDKELAIQKKYAADFATYQDYMIKDDITKLKEQYATRKAEDERAHAERLQNIIKQGQENMAQQAANGMNEGMALGGGIAGGIAATVPDIKAEADKAGKAATDSTGSGAKSKQQSLLSTLTGIFSGVQGALLGGIIGSIFGPVGTVIGAVIGSNLGNMGSAIKAGIENALNWAKNALGNLWNWGQDVVRGLGRSIASALGPAGGAFKAAWNGVGLPRFYNGGIVGGLPGKDTNVIAATRGEMILNKGQQQRMFSILSGRSNGTFGGSSGDMIIQNMTLQLPNVSNATDFEREMKLKFRAARG